MMFFNRKYNILLNTQLTELNTANDESLYY